MTAEVDPAAEAPVAETLPVEFAGRATDYFRIWIVNLGLTLVTLGVYSAWAKVRTLRWFYGNTRVGGAAFDYTADPRRILRGRLIAVGVFVLYSVVTELLPILGAALGLGLFAVGPWLIVRAHAFRLRHTTYRHVRFGFAREYGEAAKAYVLYPTLSVFSLGLLLPFTRCRQYRFTVGNARFGATPFRFDARARDFYALYAPAAVFGVAAICVTPLPRVGISLAIVIAVYGYHAISAAVTNLAYGRTTLGDVSFESTLRPARLMLLRVTNTIAVVLSLGLLVPWARVRMARYRASCLQVHAAGGLDGFVAAREEEVSALGEEMGDVFDLDVDLGF